MFYTDFGFFISGILRRDDPDTSKEYSAEFWADNFSICLWENPQVIISIISAFLDVSLGSKTNIIYFWDPMMPQQIQAQRLAILSENIFLNLRILEVQKFEKIEMAGAERSRRFIS